MPQAKYIFQQKDRKLAKKIFTHGLNATAYVLLSLQDVGEMFWEGLPDCYPGFKLMKQMAGAGRYKNYKPKKKTVTASLSRLKTQGLIVKDPVKKVYFLTPQGKKLTAYIKDRYEILKSSWDKKIRVVVFDIPERKKCFRRWLTQELSLMQFERLQDSVYVGKWPLPESFYKELAENGIEDCVFIFTAGEIGQQDKILKLFEQ